MRAPGFTWTQDAEGNVTLEIENRGIMNRIAQKLLKKPPVTYVHLEGIGNFLWPLLDGEKSILSLGELVEAQFGEEAHPLYPRLAKYFQILESYRFIIWREEGR